jgi:chromosome segregation ATPase
VYSNKALSHYPSSQALQHAQQQLASSTSDSMKREVETLRASLAQAQAELSLGSRDQLHQELVTCRSALESANADNERLRAAHQSSMDALIADAQSAKNEASAAAAKITRLQHEMSQIKRDLAEAAPKAQRCIDAEKASQADELKAVTAAAAADAAAAAAREAKDAQRQLQQELHDETRKSALLTQDVEYLRQATARLESNNSQLRDKCERQSARIQKLKAHEEELQVRGRHISCNLPARQSHMFCAGCYNEAGRGCSARH